MPVDGMDISDHLRGAKTFAFSCVLDGLAQFLALDIDQFFGERLPVVKSLLEKLGVDKAAFATSGSDDQRGKVIVCLSVPVEQATAVRVANSIKESLRSHPDWGPCDASSFQVFPTAGEGGVVRILGRNLKRGTCLDSPLSLHQELSDLCDIRPASYESVRSLAPAASSATTINLSFPRDGKLLPWAVKLIKEPWDWASVGNTGGLHKRIVRLAREFLRAYGSAGMVEYLATLNRISSNSPDLKRGSPTTNDLRDQFDQKRLVRIWEFVVAKPSTWSVVTKHDAPPKAFALYYVLATYATQNGVDPHNLGIDYGRIQSLLTAHLGKPVSKASCVKYVAAAEESRLVFIRRHGAYKGPGARGVCNVYCLIGKDDDYYALRRSIRIEWPTPAMANPTFAASCGGSDAV